ncbi:ribonuclease HII [Halobacteriovorax sp. GB3]|uniref:ribonuclease HII n=1 Tax=Halobacteriovorax sp. GB3 TaxID=2719615 RepID=UPI002361FC3E|nr:ribonuclease HII [Halobacteriovorax sp. GB3]MDD0852678.1 ribonuclease HII [Halobacteriovorax sp. GB3]
MIEFDFLKEHKFISGCDEVGRGPLAGPVVGCSVGVSTNVDLLELFDFLRGLGVTDSKKLTAKKRQKLLSDLSLGDLVSEKLYEINILKKFSVRFYIREISESLIDEINILNASLLTMKESFERISTKETALLLIDGNKVPKDLDDYIDAKTIVKGDSKSVLIGLASVIAKEYRDDLMVKLGVKYPGYGLEKHAGYPTKMHKEAIAQFGITPIHRKSFKGVKEYV